MLNIIWQCRVAVKLPLVKKKKTKLPFVKIAFSVKCNKAKHSKNKMKYTCILST